MTDNLRARIASAIEAERNKWAGGDAASETLADAVIRELKLTMEENNMPTGHEWYRRRYVTEWEPDERL